MFNKGDITHHAYVCNRRDYWQHRSQTVAEGRGGGEVGQGEQGQGGHQVHLWVQTVYLINIHLFMFVTIFCIESVN